MGQPGAEYFKWTIIHPQQPFETDPVIFDLQLQKQKRNMTQLRSGSNWCLMPRTSPGLQVP